MKILLWNSLFILLINGRKIIEIEETTKEIEINEFQNKFNYKSRINIIEPKYKSNNSNYFNSMHSTKSYYPKNNNNSSYYNNGYSSNSSNYYTKTPSNYKIYKDPNLNSNSKIIYRTNYSNSNNNLTNGSIYSNNNTNYKYIPTNSNTKTTYSTYNNNNINYKYPTNSNTKTIYTSNNNNTNYKYIPTNSYTKTTYSTYNNNNINYKYPTNSNTKTIYTSNNNNTNYKYIPTNSYTKTTYSTYNSNPLTNNIKTTDVSSKSNSNKNINTNTFNPLKFNMHTSKKNDLDNNNVNNKNINPKHIYFYTIYDKNSNYNSNNEIFNKSYTTNIIKTTKIKIKTIKKTIKIIEDEDNSNGLEKKDFFNNKYEILKYLKMIKEYYDIKSNIINYDTNRLNEIYDYLILKNNFYHYEIDIKLEKFKNYYNVYLFDLWKFCYKRLKSKILKYDYSSKIEFFKYIYNIIFDLPQKNNNNKELNKLNDYKEFLSNDFGRMYLIKKFYKLKIYQKNEKDLGNLNEFINIQLIKLIEEIYSYKSNWKLNNNNSYKSINYNENNFNIYIFSQLILFFIENNLNSNNNIRLNYEIENFIFTNPLIIKEININIEKMFQKYELNQEKLIFIYNYNNDNDFKNLFYNLFNKMIVLNSFKNFVEILLLNDKIDYRFTIFNNILNYEVVYFKKNFLNMFEELMIFFVNYEDNYKLAIDKIINENIVLKDNMNLSLYVNKIINKYIINDSNNFNKYNNLLSKVIKYLQLNNNSLDNFKDIFNIKTKNDNKNSKNNEIIKFITTSNIEIKNIKNFKIDIKIINNLWINKKFLSSINFMQKNINLMLFYYCIENKKSLDNVIDKEYLESIFDSYLNNYQILLKDLQNIYKISENDNKNESEIIYKYILSSIIEIFPNLKEKIDIFISLVETKIKNDSISILDEEIINNIIKELNIDNIFIENYINNYYMLILVNRNSNIFNDLLTKIKKKENENLKNLKDLVKDKEKDLNDLNNKLKDENDEKSKLKIEIENLRKKNSEINSSNKDNNDKMNDLQNENNNNKDEISQLNNKINDLKDKMDNDSKIKIDIENKFNTLNKKYENYINNINELILNLKNNFNSINNNIINKNNDLIELYKEKFKVFKIKIEENQKIFINIQNNYNKDIQSKKDEIENILKENKDLKLNLSIKIKEFNDKEDNYKILIDNYIKQIDIYKKEIENYKILLKDQKDKNDDSNKDLNLKINNLNEELNLKDTEINNYKIEINNYKNEITDLNIKINNINSSEINDLKEEIKSLKINILNNNNITEEFKNENTRLQNDILNFKEIIESLKLEIKNKNNKIEELNIQISELLNLSKKMQAELIKNNEIMKKQQLIIEKLNISIKTNNKKILKIKMEIYQDKTVLNEKNMENILKNFLENTIISNL